MLNPRSLVLVVDDDRAVAEAEAQIVEDAGFSAIVQDDPVKAGDFIERNPGVEMALLDMRMPILNGLELLRRIKLRRPEIGVVMATVVNDIEMAVQATKGGAYNYLLKPLQPERVAKVFASFLANRPPRLVEDARFSSFITTSPVFEEIFRKVTSFAQADLPVLVQGETGTGKELIAHLLHTLSERAQGPFLAVNAAALSPHLFESELFGHVRGAFTGALRDHAGYFETAGAGTLFLDEIGELGAEQQKKLLRVLQTRRFARVGEVGERQLEARIVCATNVDLTEAVKSRRFREDLYYRLASYQVLLPPLRQRPGDIALLARYFLMKYGSQFGRPIGDFSPEAMDALARYPFPGNVRELEGIVSGAVLLEESSQIRLETLPRHLLSAVDGEGKGGLEGVRRKAILEALAECGGNQTKAAQKLGIARGTLNRLLRQYRDS